MGYVAQSLLRTLGGTSDPYLYYEAVYGIPQSKIFALTGGL